jgi:hypothetical protein
MATKSKAGETPVTKAAKPAAKPATKPATKPTAKASTPAKAAAPVKAPAEKKPAARKAPAAKKPAAQTAASEQPNAIPVLTHDQRRYYVEVAAFYIAERRGFHGGSEMDDWVQAEEEIDRLVREGILKP